MINKKIILSAISGLLVLVTANSYATQTQVSNEVFAIEASEDSRATDILARRGADDPPGTERPGDNHRQRRGGRLIDTGVDILARRGADDPPGSERPGEVHGQKRGGRLIDTGVEILARRGADDPPGSERPGEVHGQRRGGRA